MAIVSGTVSLARSYLDYVAEPVVVVSRECLMGLQRVKLTDETIDYLIVNDRLILVIIATNNKLLEGCKEPE